MTRTLYCDLKLSIASAPDFCSGVEAIDNIPREFLKSSQSSNVSPPVNRRLWDSCSKPLGNGDGNSAVIAYPGAEATDQAVEILNYSPSVYPIKQQF
jgi:hypothetical protein